MKGLLKTSMQRGIAKGVIGVAGVAMLALTISCASGGSGPVAGLSDQNAPKPFVDTWSETLPLGTPLFAAAAGTVVRVADVFKPAAHCLALEGAVEPQKSVLIEHTLEDGRTLQSWYAHLDRIDVAVGANVDAGQRIGLSMNDGCSARLPRFHVES